MTRLINAGKKATTELEEFYKKDPYVTDSRVWPVLEHLRFLVRLFSQFDKHIHTKWFKLDNLFNLQKTVNAVRDCEEAIKVLSEVYQECKDMEAQRGFAYPRPSPPDRLRPYCFKRQTLGRLEDAAEEISAKLTGSLEPGAETFRIPAKETQGTEASQTAEITRNQSDKENDRRQMSIPPPPPLPEPGIGKFTIHCISKQQQK